MKKWISFFLFILALAPSPTFGQVTGVDSSDGGWNADSGDHYVHKRSVKKKRAPASEDQTGAAVAPSSVPTPGTKASAPATPTPSFTPSAMPRLMATPVPTPETSIAPVSSSTQSEASSNFSSKVRDMVLGGDLDLIQNYKNFLGHQDIRKNFFDIAVATGYFYNSSSSPFFTRNYNDSAPSVGVEANIWISPFFGFNADYRTTLLNELTDSPTSSATVNISQTWLDLGLKFRRFYGMTANAPVFTTALKYSIYSMTAPSVSHYRVSQQTQGVEFDFNLAIPIGKSTSVDFGFMLEPIATQSENTGAPITSGSGNQTLGAGANVAVNYRVTRQMIGFIKLSSLLYKSEYSGSTSINDPTTGGTLTNVPVTNAFYLLEFGLRLGR
jgi:hypothetical protein